MSTFSTLIKVASFLVKHPTARNATIKAVKNPTTRNLAIKAIKYKMKNK